MTQTFTGRKSETERISSRFGFYSAVLTAAVGLITFGLALMAIPNSGANCPADCVEYPYLDTLSQYPVDYLWMPLAMLLVLCFIALMVSIHAYAADHRKIFGLAGLSFGLIAAAVLLGDYYIQFAVIPVSLMNAETEGVPLLIQYNPRGVFLALEELGYLLMSLSFLFAGLALSARSRLENAARWIFLIGFALAVISLVGISAAFGLERLDRFEILVISIDWLVLIANGILLAVLFRREGSPA